MDVTEDDTIVCYAPTMVITDGVWMGKNPLDYSLPLFILQVMMIVITTRLLVHILKPFRQPRVVSEIIGGIILGPSVLGRSKKFASTIFPLRSVMVLETMANIGLLYFLFLVGLEMDITVLRRTGKKALAISIASLILPFLIGGCFSLLLYGHHHAMSKGTHFLFFGFSLSIASFPVLARLLAELKLFNTELGRIAMSSALVNDIGAWFFIVFAIAMSFDDKTSTESVWVLTSTVAFVAFYIFVVRPIIKWVIQKTPEGETFSELFLNAILTGVIVSGFITDVIGTHSMFGAFVFGLVIPNGPLIVTIIEKIEDFVSSLLLPLFFAISGMKTNIASIDGAATWVILLLVSGLACAGKVVGTVVVTSHYKMPIREGVTLGLLMNAKGLIEMIVLNLGKEEKVLDEESFAIMVMVALIMTGIITPIVTVVYKPGKKSNTYKRRTIEKTKPDTELRILVCIHTPRNVPTIINILEASQPTKKSPVCVYVLHLVELTGHASAMLIVHNTRKSGRSTFGETQAQSDHILNAFENYEQHSSCVSVQPLTVISPYSTMHEDICNLAEDKQITFIIMPFHKHQTVDGGMQATNPAFRIVNQNVLANSPCSIGILVDRGLKGSSTNTEINPVSRHIAVLFFGGADDREALAYGWRMAGNPGITLDVIRFVSDDDSIGPVVNKTDYEKEKRLEEEYLLEFMAKNANDESIVYTEKVVKNGEETVAEVRSMDSSHDLLIVGRGQGKISPLTAGLTEWSECPELGAIGDLLASSDFAATVSVLVVHQYVGLGTLEDGTDLPDNPLQRD